MAKAIEGARGRGAQRPRATPPFDSSLEDSANGKEGAAPKAGADVTDARVDTGVTEASVDAFDAYDSADALACTLDVDGASLVGTFCGGQCLDTTRDPVNCGGCGIGCEAGATCAQSTCLNVAGSLVGLEWEVPCAGVISGDICAASNPVAQTATVSGAANVTYAVTFHFTGAVEQKTYTPNPSDAGPDAGDAGPTGPVATGTNASFFIENATPASGDGYNVYTLAISAPAQTAYLNNGASNINNAFPIDYTVTIPVTSGATVTLTADTIDGEEVENVQPDGGPVFFPGLFDGGAYNGQFIQMEVVSVVAQ